MNFRDDVPRTFPQRKLVKRHFQRIETLTAYYQKLGPSPSGEWVPWYFVKNRASGEEGWVISQYVQAIEPADAQKLRDLPFERTPLPEPLSLHAAESGVHLDIGLVASVLLALLTAFGGLATAYGMGIARKRDQNVVRAQTPSNVVAFPGSNPAPDVLFGMADGQVWLHRSRSKP